MRCSCWMNLTGSIVRPGNKSGFPDAVRSGGAGKARGRAPGTDSGPAAKEGVQVFSLIVVVVLFVLLAKGLMFTDNDSQFE